MKCYKWIHKKETDERTRLINKDYEYKMGELHVMPNFDVSYDCTVNAFYCCMAEDIHAWSTLGSALFEVKIPEGTRVIDLGDKLKVDRIIVVRELEWLEVVDLNKIIINHIPYHLLTTERCAAAIKLSIGEMQYIPRHLITQEMCLDAVDRCALLF